MRRSRLLFAVGGAVLTLVLLPVAVNVATGGSAPPGFGFVRPLAWYVVAALSLLAVIVAALQLIAESRVLPVFRYSRFNRETQRRRVLEKLSAHVTGELAASLAAIPWLQPSLAVAAGAVMPSGDILPADSASSGPGDIREAFELFDRNLLILGNPGAGKSTLLLELARGLLTEAAQPDSPVPVLLSLARWKAAPRSGDGRWPGLGRRPDADYFTRWCVSQMAETSGIPRQLAWLWLREDDGVALLLDGLDEMPERERDGFIAALGEAQRERGPLAMAVTCRTAEYSRLRPRLGVQGAVEIEPLDRDRIEGLLAGDDARLAGLRQALHADGALWEVLDSPLWLALLAEEAGSGGTAAGSARAADQRAGRSGLLERYIVRALASRPYPGRFPAGPAVLRTWLATIARAAMPYTHHWWTRAWQEEADAQALAAGLLPGLILGGACGLTAAVPLIGSITPVLAAASLTALLCGMAIRDLRRDTGVTREDIPTRAVLAGFAAALIAGGLAAAVLAGLRAIRLPPPAIWLIEGPFLVIGVSSLIYQSIRADQDSHPEAVARTDQAYREAAASAKSYQHRLRQQASADPEHRAAMITIGVGLANAGTALWFLVMGHAATASALGVAAGAVAGGAIAISRGITGWTVPHPVRTLATMARPRVVLAVAYPLSLVVIVGSFIPAAYNGPLGHWLAVTTRHAASASRWPFDLLGVSLGFAAGAAIAHWLCTPERISDALTEAAARAWLTSERRLPWRVRRFEAFAAGTGLMRLSSGRYVFRHELLAEHFRENH